EEAGHAPPVGVREETQIDSPHAIDETHRHTIWPHSAPRRTPLPRLNIRVDRRVRLVQPHVEAHPVFRHPWIGAEDEHPSGPERCARPANVTTATRGRTDAGCRWAASAQTSTTKLCTRLIGECFRVGSPAGTSAGKSVAASHDPASPRTAQRSTTWYRLRRYGALLPGGVANRTHRGRDC